NKAEFVPLDRALVKELLSPANGVKISVVLEDATLSARVLLEEGADGFFDVVFLDAFSPSKNRELWSSEFIGNLFKMCKKGAYLTTFSCARIVRENLKRAGFEVGDGPRVGRRGPSTVAFKP
ncbi:hypothetical protein D6764_04890, partial [Candidatus Woesearchaeota archaeon]